MKYRKKPVVIEAIQWKGGEFLPMIPNLPWLCDAINNGTIQHDEDGLTIGTLEGRLTVSPGDWIIRGIKGEIYPCKPDIFAATYESAEPEIHLTHEDVVSRCQGTL